MILLKTHNGMIWKPKKGLGYKYFLYPAMQPVDWAFWEHGKLYSQLKCETYAAAQRVWCHTEQKVEGELNLCTVQPNDHFTDSVNFSAFSQDMWGFF